VKRRRIVAAGSAVNPRRIVAAASFGNALRDFPPDQQDGIRDSVQKFRDRTAENAIRNEVKTGLSCWAFRVPSVAGVRVFHVPRTDANGRYSLLFHVGPHDDYRTVKRKIPK
jgi:hypothetical protein